MPMLITVLTLYTLLLLHIPTPSHCRDNNTDIDDTLCANSFSVLEEDLLSRDTNRFNLLKTFYPPRGALPVFVTVTYEFDENGNETVWYWSESEIYLIQPLDILQFTSLFHSNFDYRMSEVRLVLSKECQQSETEYLEILTQRLKLYAQTERVSISSNPLRVSDIYVAIAASEDEIESDSFQSTFVKVWIHFVFILFPIATVFIVYTCDPIQLLLGDKTWQKLRNEDNHPRLAAMIQISVIFTVFVFIIDCFSFAYTFKSDWYFNPSTSGFYLTTITGFIVDLAALVWVIFILVTSCQKNCHNIVHGKFCQPIKTTHIHSLLSSITISPLLCITNHFPYIIISYISDPYHAGSISIAFFLTFILFYFVFGQFYSRVALRTGSRPKDYPDAVTRDIVHFPKGDACRRKVRVPFNTQVLLLSLVVVTPLVLFYEALLVVLFWALPITKTLEDSPTRLYTIYQGTGILIAALLTYNILLRPSPFSMAGTLDKLGKQLQVPEKVGRRWVRMGDEEKAAFVIRALYSLGNTKRVTTTSTSTQPISISIPQSPTTPSSQGDGVFRHDDVPLDDVVSEVGGQNGTPTTQTTQTSLQLESPI